MARKAKKQKKRMKGRPRGGATVPCPACEKDSRVLLTRRDGNTVIRRRQCLGPGHHLFDTTETV